MIKKSILGLFVGLLGLVGFSNADFDVLTYSYYGNIGITYSNGGYDYSFTSNGDFNTNGNKVFYWYPAKYSAGGSYFYAWYDGKLYFGSQNGNTDNFGVQGFIQNWCVSPVSNRNLESAGIHRDCVYNKSLDYIKNLNPRFTQFLFETQGVSNPNVNGNGPYNFCFSDGINDYCFSCGSDLGRCPSGLSGSLDLVSFNSNYILNYSWGFSPFGGGGGSSNNSNNTYLCPTVGQLLNTYSSEYNTGLCYSSSLIYSGNSVVSVSPQSIFELFTDQSDFINYRQLYSNNCNLSPMSDNTACSNIFQGKNLQYSLIAKIPGTVNSLSLYSYCNLALNQDPNTSTCVASGVYNTGVSRQDVINSIVNGNYQVVSPISGSITSNIIGSGEYFNGDILGSIQSIYTKFTSLFTTQSGNVVGILPGYIVVMLLVIIF